MDKNKKTAIAVALVVVALIAVVWSMKSSGVVGSSQKPPTGPPAQAMQAFHSYENHGAGAQGQH